MRMRRKDDDRLMMELTILGAHSPYAPANGALSGYLLQIDGFNIMIDCGNGTFSRLQKHIDFAKLNLAILSHLHPDHYCDVYSLRQAIGGAMKAGLREEPLIVYLPDAPESIADEIKSWDDVFHSVSIAEAMTMNNDFNLFQLEFFRTKHEPETYGLSVSQGSQRLLAYTADTGWFGELPQYCQGAKILLAEASLKEQELDKLGDRHLSASQAGRLGQIIGAETIILTHFLPTHNLYQLQRQAEAQFDGKVLLATMGKTYLITNNEKKQVI